MLRFVVIAVVVIGLVFGGLGLLKGSSNSESSGRASVGGDKAAVAEVRSVSEVALKRCPEVNGPGGFNVEVYEIDCDAAITMLVDFSNPFERYDSSQTAVYDPPSQKTWRCFARFEVAQGPIEHLCWSGNAVMRFDSQ